MATYKKTNSGPFIHNKGISTSAVNLTGSTPTPDLSLSNIFTWTLTANSTLGFPATLYPGVYYIFAYQDAGGTNTLAFNGSYIAATNTDTFSTTGSELNVIQLMCDGTSIMYTIFAEA